MPSYSTISESKIWVAFQNGDSQAFEELLKLFYPALLNYGLRLAKDSDFVKDCLQDFFIDIWNRKENLDIPQFVKAYLMSSFRRHLLREKSRNFWNKNVTDLDQEYDIEVQFNIESYLINNEIEHETLLKLKHYLGTLSKRQREVLYLRFYQELEYDEISQIMSINHHSVINLVYEALKMLRKNWVLSLLLCLAMI